MEFYKILLAIFSVAFATNSSIVDKQSTNLIDDKSSLPRKVIELLNFTKIKDEYSNTSVLDKNLYIKNIKEMKDHPHTNLETPEIIELYKYKSETHIVDSDGYLLVMHRIPGNNTHQSPYGKPVVFLMHGLFGSSLDWVITGPKRGLAFLLSDAGYDVWLGNARGNVYSCKHKNENITSKAFWTFSWHEIGAYDIPAKIDYILEKTEKKKIFYIGHSQGTTSFFVMGSEHSDYNDKIVAMFAFAPVTFSKNMPGSLFRILAMFVNSIKAATDKAEIYDILSDTKYIRRLVEKICHISFMPPEICRNVIFAFTGFNEEQFDMELLPAILAHYPAGASLYQLYHYAQLIRSGLFRQFDYDEEDNEIKYGQPTPPDYKVEQVTAPVYLYYSENDLLSHPTDVKYLQSKLANVRNMTCISDKKFNHLDYIWAKDVKNLLYEEILNIMSTIL